MSDQEFLERLNGLYYITCEGIADCGNTRVNVIKNVKNNKARFIEELPIGGVGDLIKINNLYVKTIKFVKRKIMNIFYRSAIMYPQEENDLIELAEDKECPNIRLDEFESYPNTSGLIKLRDTKVMLTTQNTTPCAVIGKGVDVSFRAAKKDGISHLVIDMLSGEVRCNVIGWNFIDTKDTATDFLPQVGEYLFYNIKVGVLNNKSYLNFDNMSIILFEFCDDYMKDIKRTTGEWNSLNYVDLRWYSKQRAILEYTTLEAALEHVNTHSNSPVSITINNVSFDIDKWKTRFFVRHTRCGEVTKYAEGLQCTKCHYCLDRDDDWWLLTNTKMELNGKKYNVNISDKAYTKILNQIDLSILNTSTSEFKSFNDFKTAIKDNPIDEINQLEELYVDFLDGKEFSIRLKITNNGKGGMWAISHVVSDIIFD